MVGHEGIVDGVNVDTSHQWASAAEYSTPCDWMKMTDTVSVVPSLATSVTRRTRGIMDRKEGDSNIKYK